MAGGIKLVMVKSKNQGQSYTYGNIAYDIKPEKKKIKKKKRSVKKQSNVKVKDKLKLISYIGVVFLLAFLTIARFTVILKMSADIRDVKSQIKRVQKDNENIRVELARIDNIKSIEEIAVSQYGMVVPKREQIVYVDVKPINRAVEKPKQTAFQMIQRLLGLIY
jgi:cell division protein FtsL